ncbi:MAG: hypothetical protein ABSF77_19465 [Spirochaetia bacterium]
MRSHTLGRPGLWVALLSLLLVGPRLWSLDLADGRIRLTLQEGIGRFSLSCQTKGNTGVFVPLLAAQDPRTSMLSIVVGNRIYRMGESSDFSEKAERTSTGGRFIWKSSFLQVTESFSFIASNDSSVTNGIRIDLSLKNLSEQDITVGVRYLFDTYLGESSFVHFRTDTLSQVTHELTLTSSQKVAYWISPLAGDSEDFGLQVMTSGAGITVPDRIVLANWKRLSDSSWSYETSSARNFSLLPYSINDSAACQYYDPRSIPRTGEATITLAMGVYSKGGFSAALAGAQDFSAGVQQSLAAAKNAPDKSQAVRTDLATVDRLMAEIDKSLSSAETMSDEELAVVESALKDLESRASGYDSAGK